MTLDQAVEVGGEFEAKRLAILKAHQDGLINDEEAIRRVRKARKEMYRRCKEIDADNARPAMLN